MWSAMALAFASTPASSASRAWCRSRVDYLTYALAGLLKLLETPRIAGAAEGQAGRGRSFDLIRMHRTGRPDPWWAPEVALLGSLGRRSAKPLSLDCAGPTSAPAA